MDSVRKMRMFKALVAMGFKEIEVGFPSASTDFNFPRELIEGGHIPDDVTVQVLTQAREHLIDRTIDVCVAQTRLFCIYITPPRLCNAGWCLKKTRQGVKEIATDGAKMVADGTGQNDTNTAATG